MEYILCKNCQHGSPAYLQYCGNCNADLLALDDAEPSASQNADSTFQSNSELSDETLRRNTLIAITMWCFTTILKVWFLYSNSQWTSPQLNEVLFVISPVVIAAIAAQKFKRWYRVLFADSILMILGFAVVMLIFTASKYK